MRKQITGALIGAALLPGLSGCAQSDVDGIEMGMALVPILAVAMPVAAVQKAVEEAKIPPGEYLPEPRELWKKNSTDESASDIDLAKCGYTSIYQERASGTAQYAEEMAQRAACMEQATYHYAYSTAKRKYKMFNVGAAQDLSYGGICKNYAQYHILACRKGARLRTQAIRAQSFQSYCAKSKNKGRDSCLPLFNDKEFCARSYNKSDYRCSAGMVKESFGISLTYFNSHCYYGYNDNGSKLKPECSP